MFLLSLSPIIFFDLQDLLDDVNLGMATVRFHAMTPDHFRIPEEELATNPKHVSTAILESLVDVVHLVHLAHDPSFAADALHVPWVLAWLQHPLHTQRTIQSFGGVGIDRERTVRPLAIRVDEFRRPKTDDRDRRWFG